MEAASYLSEWSGTTPSSVATLEHTWEEARDREDTEDTDGVHRRAAPP